MKNPKVVKANPNRANIFLRKKQRSKVRGDVGYEEILVPFAEQLMRDREHYPLTLIYFNKIRLDVLLNPTSLACSNVMSTA